MRQWLVGVVALAGCVAACGPGPGLLGAPELPDYDQVDPNAVRLNVSKKMTEPFVMDWQSGQRADLEIALSHGPAIVRFDQNGFELLSECRAQGKYEYNGVSPKEDTKVFRSRAELHANLPVGAASLEGELKADGQVRVEIFVVGKHSLAGDVRREQLEGNCAGATHVIRKATVGAFRRMRAAARSGRVAGEGFGSSAEASGAGESAEGMRDGDFGACSGADPDASKAPSKCRSVLQVLLVPLDGASAEQRVTAGGPQAPASPPVTSERPECAAGMAWDGSACVEVARIQAEQRAAERRGTTAPVASYECSPTDAQECVAQCKAGSLGSCTTLGLMLMTGSQLAKDEARALALWERTCKLKEPKACTMLNVYYTEKEDWQRALLWGSKGCLGGEPGACTNLGVQAYFGRGTRQNRGAALQLWLRACKMRDYQACANAGVMVVHGQGGANRNPAAGRTLFERGCTDTVKVGCTNLAGMLELGFGGAKDLGRALKLYLEECQKGSATACVGAGLVIEEQSPTPDHLRKALTLYEQGCAVPPNGGCLEESEMRESYGDLLSSEGYHRRSCDGAPQNALACFNAGIGHERGYGGSVDTARSASFLKKACDEGLKKACRSPKPGTPRRM